MLPNATVKRTGPIPAPAGEPLDRPILDRPGAVYPRACGGTDGWDVRQALGNGLSPRLRGNHGHTPCCASARPSIPAPAGEPLSATRITSGWRVYPRAAGEPQMRDDAGLHTTVYPRACGGTPGANTDLAHMNGSIPAPAGEPTRCYAICDRVGVYPRACGGTQQLIVEGSAFAGLSPRLRGNHLALDQPLTLPRSIPAPAGNRGVPRGHPGGAGSIPAPAGEPWRSSFRTHWRAVYPRACGGTSACSTWVKSGTVYPRACGGTTMDCSPSLASSVYPRACGGTDNPGSSNASMTGLSPRLRGNRVETLPRRPVRGSIPAPAGEPITSR